MAADEPISLSLSQPVFRQFIVLLLNELLQALERRRLALEVESAPAGR